MDANRPQLQANSVPTTLPFRAVIVPHRSLSPQGFLVLMSVLSAASFITGIIFAAMGAWPVLGFFGLDVAIVYLAFKLNYRSARSSETVEVTRDDLTVTRSAPNGRRSSITRVNPTWVRLEEHESPDGSVALSLASRGRSISIARDLSSDERRSFAKALRAALRLVRQADKQ